MKRFNAVLLAGMVLAISLTGLAPCRADTGYMSTTEALTIRSAGSVTVADEITTFSVASFNLADRSNMTAVGLYFDFTTGTLTNAKFFAGGAKQGSVSSIPGSIAGTSYYFGVDAVATLAESNKYFVRVPIENFGASDWFAIKCVRTGWPGGTSSWALAIKPEFRRKP